MATTPGVPTKALRSLLLLVNWEIWKEHNARMFTRKELSVTNLFFKIKEEAHSWGLAGAKDLAALLMFS